MLELNNLYNMDCMDGMKEFPDKYFDLAIVDIMEKKNILASKFWDVPDRKYFTELIRVSKNQIIWGVNYFPDMPYLGSGRIVWDKKNDASSFSKCEIAYCSLHNRTEIFRYLWNGMLQENMRDKEKRIHPTQKPIALYLWILNKYAKQGDKILDTHVGSASSLIACHRLGFDYIGFEIDSGYYEAAIKRINDQKQQMYLIKPAMEEQ